MRNTSGEQRGSSPGFIKSRLSAWCKFNARGAVAFLFSPSRKPSAPRVLFRGPGGNPCQPRSVLSACNKIGRDGHCRAASMQCVLRDAPTGRPQHGGPRRIILRWPAKRGLEGRNALFQPPSCYRRRETCGAGSEGRTTAGIARQSGLERCSSCLVAPHAGRQNRKRGRKFPGPSDFPHLAIGRFEGASGARGIEKREAQPVLSKTRTKLP
jgi:hypothetical protein